LKINPFGLFVELDPEIHGLAHISELSSKPIQSPTEVAKIGDTLKFKIISIEPVDHRLGLSLRGAKEKSSEKPADEKVEEVPVETPAKKPAEEVKAEEPNPEAPKEETPEAEEKKE
ncbi:MAG: S1 RNA-binding domain-containing protein, partial [Patescibacteria group bacterium]